MNGNQLLAKINIIGHVFESSLARASQHVIICGRKFRLSSPNDFVSRELACNLVRSLTPAVNFPEFSDSRELDSEI